MEKIASKMLQSMLRTKDAKNRIPRFRTEQYSEVQILCLQLKWRRDTLGRKSYGTEQRVQCTRMTMKQMYESNETPMVLEVSWREVL